MHQPSKFVPTCYLWMWQIIRRTSFVRQEQFQTETSFVLVKRNIRRTIRCGTKMQTSWRLRCKYKSNLLPGPKWTCNTFQCSKTRMLQRFFCKTNRNLLKYFEINWFKNNEKLVRFIIIILHSTNFIMERMIHPSADFIDSLNSWQKWILKTVRIMVLFIKGQEGRLSHEIN